MSCHRIQYSHLFLSLCNFRLCAKWKATHTMLCFSYRWGLARGLNTFLFLLPLHVLYQSSNSLSVGGVSPFQFYCVLEHWDSSFWLKFWPCYCLANSLWSLFLTSIPPIQRQPIKALIPTSLHSLAPSCLWQASLSLFYSFCLKFRLKQKAHCFLSKSQSSYIHFIIHSLSSMENNIYFFPHPFLHLLISYLSFKVHFDGDS